MLKPTDKRFVCVTWRDPHGTGKASCLYEHELPHSTVQISTYGWLMREDDKGVSVVGEIIADGSMRDYTFVPKELIDSIEDIHINRGRVRGKKHSLRHVAQADAGDPRPKE